MTQALGDTLIDVVHVESTAAPDPVANPVLDIQITVRASSGEAAHLPQLSAVGYVLVHREPDWFEHRMLRRCDPAANLHVFSHGCAEVERVPCQDLPDRLS